MGESAAEGKRRAACGTAFVCKMPS